MHLPEPIVGFFGSNNYKNGTSILELWIWWFNITINSTSDMSVLLLKEPLLVPGYAPLFLRSRLYQNTGTDTILYKIHFVK